MNVIVVGCVLALCLSISTAQRDPFTWPFATYSIWNIPIGSNASYTPSNYEFAVHGVFADIEEIFMTPDAPLSPLYINGHFSANRCADTTYWRTVPIPTSVVIPDASAHNTPNGCGAFLMPDNRTIVQANPVSRCVAGGPVTAGYKVVPDVDLYGNGTFGSRGGSGLSTLGGSLRMGELIGNVPIRHALKILPWAQKYLNYTKENEGFRWPAYKADSYAPSVYAGKNPQFLMGSLLAIPPWITVESTNITTPPALLLFRALQDYGAYVVGDAYQDVHQICIQTGADLEFEKYYGYSFQTSDTNPWREDVSQLFQHLYIVTNNQHDRHACAINSPNTLFHISFDHKSVTRLPHVNPSTTDLTGQTPRQPLAPPLTTQASMRQIK